MSTLVQSRRGLVGALCAAIAAVMFLTLSQAPAANASSALGCTFNASTPYKTAGGTLWSQVTVRCSTPRTLYIDGNLKRDRFGPDVLAGTFSDVAVLDANQGWSRWIYNNVNMCPGSGPYYGVATIRTGPFATAYQDRSASASISHC
jgi:hypothetical protein